MRTIILLLALTIATITQACEFEFGTKGNIKNCKAGDEIIITVRLSLTHRNCKVAAKDTKFKFEGIQVVGATDWVAESPLVLPGK